MEVAVTCKVEEALKPPLRIRLASELDPPTVKVPLVEILLPIVVLAAKAR